MLAHQDIYMLPRITLLINILLLSNVATKTFAHISDSAGATRRWSIEASAVPGYELAIDEYQKKWLKNRGSFTFSLKLGRTALPSDSDVFAADYNYPELAIGASFQISGVNMQRSADPAWGYAEMVDYKSRMGNSASVYGVFTRPLLRSRRWLIDYSMSYGVCYHHKKYSPHDNIDNESIGSRWLIYFGAGVHVMYHVADDWGIRLGCEFFHHSNGALNRPNKGSNTIGPSIGLCYVPAYNEIQQHSRTRPAAYFKKRLYATVTLGLGGKTLYSDWSKTQFHTKPGEPRYRTSRFKVYPIYELQSSLMYRYARRWASGIGADISYLPYAKSSVLGDEGHHHTPWSVGISANHEAFYHQISLFMSLGFYVKRDRSLRDIELEKPYYERIGIGYTFSRLNNMRIGISIKAHKTKADYTSFSITYPFWKK